jgi:hypothetical protein
VLMIEIHIIFLACVCQESIVTRLFFTSIKWRQNKTSFLKEVSFSSEFLHPCLCTCVLNLVKFIVSLWRSILPSPREENG